MSNSNIYIQDRTKKFAVRVIKLEEFSWFIQKVIEIKKILVASIRKLEEKLETSDFRLETLDLIFLWELL